MNRHSVVIGAGIVGASCAWHLQRKGRQVTLVDPELPGDACSFGNASCIATSGVVPLSVPGIIRKVPGWLMDPLGPVTIRPGHFPALVPWLWKFWRVCNKRSVEAIAGAQALLMHEVLADWDAILAAIGASHLKQSPGAIHLYDTEKEYLDDKWQFELNEKLGFEHHRLGREELKSLVPELKLEKGVALMASDWHHLVDPAKATARIAEDCINNGGQWIQDRVATIAANGSGVSIKTATGRAIEADEAVIAAGAWSNSLAEQLDHRVPLIAERGYHSQVGNPGIELKHPVMSLTRHFVMTPLEGGLRIAGTAEFAALDAEPDYRRARVLLKLAGLYLDGFEANDVTEWMHENVYYAFGHGHYGITQGPTTGRIIADMVTDGKPPLDVSAYRFDRFARGIPGP